MTTNTILLSIVILCSYITIIWTFLCVYYDHGHCYFVYLYHHYTNILLHWTLLFYILESSLYGILLHWTLLFYILVSQIYWFTWVHDLIVLISLLHEYLSNIYIRLFMYHNYWLLLTRLLLLDLDCYWYSICGTKCHVEIVLHGAKCHTTYICGGANLLDPWGLLIESIGATSRMSHLLFHVILFNDTNNTHVLISYYKLHALLLFLIFCAVKI